MDIIYSQIAQKIFPEIHLVLELLDIKALLGLMTQNRI
jgi:hypothetical protein